MNTRALVVKHGILLLHREGKCGGKGSAVRGTRAGCTPEQNRQLTAVQSKNQTLGQEQAKKRFEVLTSAHKPQSRCL